MKTYTHKIVSDKISACYRHIPYSKPSVSQATRRFVRRAVFITEPLAVIPFGVLFYGNVPMQLTCLFVQVISMYLMLISK